MKSTKRQRLIDAERVRKWRKAHPKSYEWQMERATKRRRERREAAKGLDIVIP